MSFCKRFSIVVDDQRGIALISALLLLLVVSLMAVAVSMDTSMDIRIAGYQRFSAMSFGSADGGGLAATDILEGSIDSPGSGWNADLSDIVYEELSDLYNGTIIIKQGNTDFDLELNLNEDPVLVMTGDIEAVIAVQRGEESLSKGGAVQTAAGYSGLGKAAAAGGVNKYYNIISTGTGAGNARTGLAMHYRYLTK